MTWYGEKIAQLQQPVHEATLAAAGSKATYAGASTSILGWFLSSEFGILFGIFMALAGFLVNWYYKAKQDKRDQEIHEMRLKTGYAKDKEDD